MMIPLLGSGCQPKVGILDLLLAMFMVCESDVCPSVCLSVGHADVLWQNGWTDRDAVWRVGWGGPQSPCIRGGSRSSTPFGRGNFGVGIYGYARGRYLSRCRLACGLGWTQLTMYYMGVGIPQGEWAILGVGKHGHAGTCLRSDYRGSWILQQKWQRRLVLRLPTWLWGNNAIFCQKNCMWLYTASQNGRIFICDELGQKPTDFRDFWQVKSWENLTFMVYRFAYLSCQL